MVIARSATFLAVMLMSVFTCNGIFEYSINRHEDKPYSRNCWELLHRGYTTDGTYTIFPNKYHPDYNIQVYCDMYTEGGGWTVFQRRTNKTHDYKPIESFSRTWMEYALGFGHVDYGEFWIGNENLHLLTDQTLNELRIELADFEGEYRFAKYSFFYVHNSDDKYRLRVLGYSGDAGDSLAIHDGMNFSTIDEDNDNSDGHCADNFDAGWWFNNCYKSNLNGVYLIGEGDSPGGVNYNTFRGDEYSLKKSEMKIRPA